MGVRSRMGVVSSGLCHAAQQQTLGMHVEEDQCGGSGLDRNGVVAQDQFKSLVEGKYN